MAVAPDGRDRERETDVSMLEVVAADSIVGTLQTQTTMEREQFIVVTDYHHQEEFTTRPSRESVLQRLSEALLRHSLAKIDLSQRGLRPSDARLVKMALSQNANLSVLKLGYNNLGDEGVTTLAAGIAVHRSLVSLDLGFNNFGDEGCKSLAVAMQQACQTNNHTGTIRTLYLAGNSIGEDGAIALADCIRQGSCLKKLYLTGNRLGADGIKAITEAIVEDELRRSESTTTCMDENFVDVENPANDDSYDNDNNNNDKPPSADNSSFRGMQELFFGGTGMGSAGALSVARLLEKSSCLRVISLPNCNIGDEELSMLASGIRPNRDKLPLESIQLSFNNITYKGLEALINAVWGSSTLRELRLDNNDIGDRGAHQVAAILPVVKTLEVLDVGFNSIKAAGLNTLMKAVAETQHLKSLSVSGNAIDVAAAKAVAYALAYNHSLQSLYLVHCTIGHEGQRHISAGVVSNSNTSIRKLTGFDLGPVILTLGFPTPIEHWANEQVLNFVHLMWQKSKGDVENSDAERELDPLNFLAGPSCEASTITSAIARGGPLEASIVVEVARKAYENLVENGVDVFSRRRRSASEPSFGSPLAGDAIMVESPAESPPNGLSMGDSESAEIASDQIPSKPTKSFVAAPESSEKKHEMPDPARKKRIVEWLCKNIQHLNELSRQPFNSSELWRLHQHYFTPVVNESGGTVAPQCSGSRILSNVPEAYRGNPGGSAVTASTLFGSEDFLNAPVSDPALPASPVTTSLPVLKRKVSYRFLGDAAQSHSRFESRLENHLQHGSVAKMIEDGHTGHSLPPKTKRARRNCTRISFVPRIKAKLDSYLDVCHEKALITMRRLYFVEQAILCGRINPLEPSATRRTHLSGTLAAEAEMIIVDMI